MKILEINNDFIRSDQIKVDSYDNSCRDFYPSFIVKSNRIMCVYIGAKYAKEYVENIFKLILEIDRCWFLVPRCSFNEFRFNENTYDIKILKFERVDFTILSSSLCDYLDKLRCVSDDVFLINQKNNIIVSVSHHFQDEGIIVEFSEKSKCSKLLSSFNEIECQIELFSNGL